MMVEQKNLQAQTLRDATRVTMKLASLVPSLQALEKSKHMHQVPEYIRKAVVESREVCQKMQKEAAVALAGKHAGPLSFTISKLATNMIESISAHVK